MIRSATIWDAMEILEMWCAMMEEINYEGRYVDDRERKKFYVSIIFRISNPVNIVLVSETDGLINGFISGTISECSEGSDSLITYCDNIYIKPESRNNGVWLKMIKEYESISQAKGAKEMMFETIYDPGKAGAWKKKGYSPYKIQYRKEF